MAKVEKSTDRFQAFYNITGTREEVDREVKGIMEEYPPAGYGTWVKQEGFRGKDYWALVTHFLSCD